ncbi:hypothetical protein LSTR_LSTR001705 [Laodelphax striatellus]|uniref:Borealin C-terminal domain-containing protein n=1 Tax=Laodelphax striatellus TaxID=195883 RepID=A0A482XC83_LAOST|nr:hypothetical protein LSTR_LSTR001705 [Laodelphax striatellus]
MPAKKRSTAFHKSRRVTRKKESIVTSTSTTVLSGEDIPESSTPKKETLRLTKQQISKVAEELDTEIQNKIDEYVESVTMLKLSLKKNLLKTPLWEFEEYRRKYAVDAIDLKEEIENVEPKRKSRRLRTSSVDRFKLPATSTLKKPTGRVSRSRSRSVTRATNLMMKTPNMSQFGVLCEMTPITPKFNINTPVSVLRQPRLGEQAVSLSGSPLHVAIPTAVNPTVNEPLSDGNVMTILPPLGPHPHPHPQHLPPLDPECRDKLLNIQKYLAQMLNGNNSD